MVTPRRLPEAAVPAYTPAPLQGIGAARYRCEADVAPGLETIAQGELRHLLGWGDDPDGRAPRRGIIPFGHNGDLAELLRLRTVLSAYLIQRFPVPRPRALLGDQHFRTLLHRIDTVRGLHVPGTFGTLYISAAGSESSVLVRLKEAIAHATGLTLVPADAHEGDLHLRFRRPPDGEEGWEALIRLSPRPLGARPWRVCNREGALNATVAHAMALLTNPDPRDHVLNLGSGSGTLLIERAICAPAARLIGCDLSAEALACARANVAAADLADAIELRQEDARALDLPDASIDVLCADLPFGHLVGSHQDNLALYPAILREAARVARRDAPFVLITHEVRLMEGLLATAPEWAIDEVLHLTLGGLHPRIFVLHRR